MKKTSIATTALVGVNLSETAAAAPKTPTPNVLEQAIQLELEDNVFIECKGKFASAMTTFYPADQPGQAMEDMTLKVCLEYSHFIPCKYKQMLLRKGAHIRHETNRGHIRLELHGCRASKACQQKFAFAKAEGPSSLKCTRAAPDTEHTFD